MAVCITYGTGVYLSWPCVHHRRRKDRHNRAVGIENFFVHQRLVLFDSPRQRYVVIFRPAACIRHHVTSYGDQETQYYQNKRLKPGRLGT